MAIVGASRSCKKFGNTATKELLERGYEVIYIHSEAKCIDGHPTQPNLQAVNGQVECAFVSILARKGKMVLRDAATASI